MWMRAFLLWAVFLGAACFLSGCRTAAEPESLAKGDSLPGWTQFDVSEINHKIFAFALVSPDEGWAVGERGAILHYQGGRWQPWKGSPTGNHLFSLSFLNAEEGWAVGAWGTVLRYTRGEWKAVEAPPEVQENILRSVLFLSPDEGWIVGEEGTILHYSGEKWEKIPPPVLEQLAEEKKEERYEQLGLMEVTGFEKTAGFFNAIALPTPHEGWIVGNLGQILHYNGTDWKNFPSPTERNLLDVCFTSPQEGWAVGPGGLMLHYDGKEWQEVPPLTIRHLISLYCAGSGHVYAGGASGTLLHYDGKRWEEVAAPKRVNLYALSGSENLLYILSSTRNIFRSTLASSGVPGGESIVAQQKEKHS